MGDIKVGGNLVGSTAAAGDHNVQTVTFSGSDASERERVLEALQKIEAVLVELKGTSASTAQRAAATAVDAAKVQKVDKAAIGSALQTAINAAKTAAEFSTIASKLASPIQTAAAWLGGQWASLLTSLV
jgi:hypothetical protein